MRRMCREKASCLFELGAEKIAFPYYYISAFCSMTERLIYKIFIEQKFLYKRNVERKNTDHYLNKGQRKSHFPLIVCSCRTDIFNYRVASLIETERDFEEKSDFYHNQGQKKSRFPLIIADGQTCGRKFVIMEWYCYSKQKEQN